MASIPNTSHCPPCGKIIRVSCLKLKHIVSCEKCGMSYCPRDQRACPECDFTVPVLKYDWLHDAAMEWLEKFEDKYGTDTFLDHYQHGSQRSLIEENLMEMTRTAKSTTDVDLELRHELVQRGLRILRRDQPDLAAAVRTISDNSASRDAVIDGVMTIQVYEQETMPLLSNAVEALKQLKIKSDELRDVRKTTQGMYGGRVYAFGNYCLDVPLP